MQLPYIYPHTERQSAPYTSVDYFEKPFNQRRGAFFICISDCSTFRIKTPTTSSLSLLATHHEQLYKTPAPLSLSRHKKLPAKIELGVQPSLFFASRRRRRSRPMRACDSIRQRRIEEEEEEKAPDACSREVYRRARRRLLRRSWLQQQQQQHWFKKQCQ